MSAIERLDLPSDLPESGPQTLFILFAAMGYVRNGKASFGAPHLPHLPQLYMRSEQKER